MYIVPVQQGTSPVSPSPNVVEIRMLARNRTDILLMFLRVIRYLFQNGIAGENLVWDGDDTKTKIWIENNSPEIFQDDNKRPAIFIDVGTVTYATTALNDNKATYHMGTYSKYSEHDLAISLTVIGRNKIETHKLSERLGASLYVLQEEIVAHTVNLESISPIQVGQVTQLRAGPGSIAGDTTLAFTAPVSFRVKYYLEFPMMQIGDLFTSATFEITPTSKDGTETAADVKINMVYSGLINR